MEASKEQMQAIRHYKGPMMVLAGPGSGKTFVITRRIRYLIEYYGVPPEQILVITFTKAAASEMKDRFEQFMEGAGSGVCFGTFHAVYFQILKRSYHYDLTNIITEKEKREYLREILDGSPWKEEIGDSCIPLLLNDFSYLKNHGKSAENFEASYLPQGSFREIFEEYKKKMRFEKKLDFDDIILMCLNLFTGQPETLALWQNIYRYILIDEFQDINRMQYEVVRLLAKPEHNLFVVGDDDQAIYGFRGSDPTIMLQFPKEFKDCKKVVLKDNYRCTDRIVKGALNLIEHNKNRFTKRLQAVKKGNRDLFLTGCMSREKEADEITELIKSYRKYGVYRDIAILFRTNQGASFLAQKLARERIPFWQSEKTKNLFEDPMALDILAMFRFALGEHDRKYFLRFMNKPVRYIRRDMLPPKVDIYELSEIKGLGNTLSRNIRKLAFDLMQIRGMEPYAAVNYIRKGMGYELWAVQNAREKGRSGEEELAFLDWLQDSAKGMETFREWLDMINTYEKCISGKAVSEKEDAVALMTMHGSKGLEYKVVILPDLNEGNVPQRKAVTAEELEEERRVFYVAMTRAREKLFLFYVRKTKENRLQPSRFLKEIGSANHSSESSESISSSNS